MMRIFWTLFLLMPFSLWGQHRLEVVVSGVTSAEGNVLVAIYQEASSFPKFGKVFRNGKAPAEMGETKVVLEDLPAGQYALAVFHDENGNDALDKNWLGLPKEDYGFSMAKTKAFGPPSFEECLVILKEDMTLTIPLE
jgi:uncharacterized protein (DUF2141 family)